MKTNADLVSHLRRTGVSGRLLGAFAATDRAHFVPTSADPAGIYLDAPVGLRQGQTTSQPSVIAAMVDALGAQGGDLILEVGTGYGYQTAILARLVRRVVTIDRHEALVRQARRRLAEDGITNVHLVLGDGTRGVPEEAPYDGIIVSAAAARLPRALAAQLADGARLVIPLGPGGDEEVLVFEKRAGAIHQVRRLFGARFVPLVEGV